MTTRAAAALICKSIAVFFFLFALSKLLSAILPTRYSSGSTDPAPIFGWFDLLPFVIWILVGCFLWFGSHKIALRMADAAETPGTLVVGSENRSIAFFAVGLLILVQALPRMVLQLLQGYLMVRVDPVLHGVEGPLTMRQIATGTCQIVFGLWLMCGAPGVIKLMQLDDGIDRDKEEVVH